MNKSTGKYFTQQIGHDLIENILFFYEESMYFQ